VFNLGAKEDIMRWLKEEDLEVNEISVPSQAPVEWVINAATMGPLKVSISIQKPKGRSERYVCSLGVMVAEEHKQKLSKLSEKERVSMTSELLRNLILLCPSCIVIFQPDLNRVESIMVTKIIYKERLTQSELTDAIRLLTNSYSMIVSYFSVKLGVSQEGGHTVMHM